MFFFFQAEDGIRDAQESRGLGDVYKRQDVGINRVDGRVVGDVDFDGVSQVAGYITPVPGGVCLLYTSDAADDLLCVDLGGRRIIKKKNRTTHH
mgnify:CR=1 FL=1